MNMILRIYDILRRVLFYGIKLKIMRKRVMETMMVVIK